MDPQTQASFIPKKPIVAGVSRTRAPMSLLWVIAFLCFLGSLIAAGGAFAYHRYLQSAIVSESDSLKREQAAYDPAVIKDILRLSQRLTQANSLLNAHLAPLAIFTYLEQHTLQNVRFTDFSYKHSPDGSVLLSLSGEALDFSSVALQSDAFDATSTPLKDVLFSGVNVDKSTGRVAFKVTATFDPSALLYVKNLSQTEAPANASSTNTQSAPMIPASSTPTQ